jgi:hypothetical protein
MNLTKSIKLNISFPANLGAISAHALMALALVLPPLTAIATLCNAQDGAAGSKPKPNIAVSGCLKREGYGGLAVTDAKIDATGEGAATATAGSGKPASKDIPPKFILDHPGPAGQHVGEQVQVIGVSSWVDETKGGTQTPHSDEPPSIPHIEVQSVKILADSCS